MFPLIGTDINKEVLMKAQVFVEHAGIQLNDQDLYKRVKVIWTEAGNKIKDISSIKIYVKPEEMTVYYVINDTFSGSFEM